MTQTVNIEDIHPDLEPINGAPNLFSFYGCGTRLFGDRDYSDATKSSVKTLYFSIFYIPLIPLKTYRVVKDGGKYYFLGKVPVSGTARKVSLASTVLGGLAIAGFGAHQYLTSESYRFGKRLDVAEAAMSEARYADAMREYKDVYEGSDAYRYKAVSGVGTIMNENRLASVSDAELADVLTVYNAFGATPLSRPPEDVYALAVDRVKTSDGVDNVSVHRLLHASQELVEQGEDLSEIDAELVETINRNDPENLDAAVELSERYYFAGDLERVKAVLDPVKENLGDSEGARVLGQVYIAEGRNAEAYPLLSTYTAPRLKHFQDAEVAFTELQESLWDREFNRLNNGTGPDSFYTEYENTPEAAQQIFVDDYINGIVTQNPRYVSALNIYRDAAAIVPIVMDFGILQLRRAEGLSSQLDRDAELKAAEDTFLSIRNVAGDTDDYKIYLGQVYFWLGKQDEGQALFNEILDSNDRSTRSLLSVAYTLRTLGKVGLAKDLAKEAYDGSSDDQMKYEAANLMNLMSLSIEDRIEWLELSDPNAPYVQASLKESKGQLAAQKGDTKSAVRYYKEAIEHSEALADSAATYNNRALIYFSLHTITGDEPTFKKGADLMTKAVSLQPDDSILLSNAADTLLISSFYDVLDDKIEYAELNDRPSFSSLSWHYRNEAEKDLLRQKLRQNNDFQKSIDYRERSVLLAPNNARNYSELVSIYRFMDDEEAMTKIVDRMADNQVDSSDSRTAYFDFISGEDDAETLEKLTDRESSLRDLLSNPALNSATKGAVYDTLSDNLLSQAMLGRTERVSTAIEYAEQAVKLLPSSRTSSNLSRALLTEASIEASEALPAYKTLRENWVKAYSDTSLVTLSVGQPGEISDWFKANDSFKKSAAMESRDISDFPKQTGLHTWALLEAADDPAAKVLKENIESSDIEFAARRASRILQPYAGNVIAQEYWMAKMSGEDGLNSETLNELASTDVSIPRLLFD